MEIPTSLSYEVVRSVDIRNIKMADLLRVLGRVRDVSIVVWRARHDRRVRKATVVALSVPLTAPSSARRIAGTRQHGPTTPPKDVEYRSPAHLARGEHALDSHADRDDAEDRRPFTA